MNSCSSLLKSIPRVIFNSLRTYDTKLPEPIQYHGFKYYPRHEDFKDPIYTPSKLFLVTRIKSLSGRNPMEKKILANLNLDGPKKLGCHINIVKNIPESNAMLWKIKHLVKIQPITWKGELPKDGDYTGTYLKSTGEFIISPKLKISEEQLQATENEKNQQNWPRTKYLKEHLKKRWQNSLTLSP